MVQKSKVRVTAVVQESDRVTLRHSDAAIRYTDATQQQYPGEACFQDSVTTTQYMYGERSPKRQHPPASLTGHVRCNPLGLGGQCCAGATC